MRGLAALTERSLRAGARDGEMIFEIFAPIAYLGGFSVALSGLVDTGSITYSQYLVPAVVVQAMVFVGLITADRTVRDHQTRFGTQMRTLPIAAITPVTARMAATLARGTLALSVAMIAGFVFGFRMTGGLYFAIVFVLVALLLCLAVALGADALGSSMDSLQGASYVLFVPQLLLFMLSTGIAPEATFPEWLRPFVRNQPVSQVAEALRGLGSGHLVAHSLWASLAWCFGMIAVFGALTVRLQRRAR